MAALGRGSHATSDALSSSSGMNPDEFVDSEEMTDTVDMEAFGLESSMEPMSRSRSNTWPSKRHEPMSLKDPLSERDEELARNVEMELGVAKKGSSRRNAWGNLSYADLITRAIESNPEKRLTLSQIYDWMVKYVPYFNDKGETNSSAGWKNSIRHNLSLHDRFIRVQNNEGTGKSSWWMINPEPKQKTTPASAKAHRRRASTLDTATGRVIGRRGRHRKRPEQLKRAGSSNSFVKEEKTAQPSSSFPNVSSNVSPNSLDGAPSAAAATGFANSLIWDEIRPRAHSNASSIGQYSPMNPRLAQQQANYVGGSDYDTADYSPISPSGWPDFDASPSTLQLGLEASEHLADTFDGQLRLSAAAAAAVGGSGGSGDGSGGNGGGDALALMLDSPSLQQSPSLTERQFADSMMNLRTSPSSGHYGSISPLQVSPHRHTGQATSSSIPSNYDDIDALLLDSQFSSSDYSRLIDPYSQANGGAGLSSHLGLNDLGGPLLQPINPVRLGDTQSATQSRNVNRPTKPSTHHHYPQQHQHQQQQQQSFHHQQQQHCWGQETSAPSLVSGTNEWSSFLPEELNSVDPMPIENYNCDVDTIIKHELSLQGGGNLEFD